MCGIAGIVGAGDGAHLDAMVRRLGHRGPDDRGWVMVDGAGVHQGREAAPSGPVLFGHTRLAIIDLTSCGAQPMGTPDGRLWMTYNGELYNYVELREELVGLGSVFRSSSDTEVVLEAWRQWGTAALSRFIGMFAFALLDRDAGEVHLVRDPFGIKPLFYATDGPLVFASEIAALLEHPSVSRAIDPQHLYEYLRWGLTDHDEGTMLTDVHRVPAASVLTFDVRTATRRDTSTYWHLRRETADISFAEAAAELRNQFTDSVRLHLRSDVPVGVALSGGIDSSALLGTMRLLEPDVDLHTFSYVTDDARFDERRWIDMAAEAAGASTHLVSVSPTDVVEEFGELVRSQGEPFASTSIVAQRRVFAEAKRSGVTVLLDGQGADELFGGYRSYLAVHFASLVRRGQVAEAASLARNVARMPGVRLDAPTVMRVVAGVMPRAVAAPLLRAAGRGAFPAWLDQAWFHERGVVGGEVRRATSLEGALDHAFSTTSLPALLRYEDRNSMASSRETRVPFLTTALVDFVFTLPTEHLVTADGTSKAVFRAAMRGVVPDPILDRRDKVGFNTPEDTLLDQLEGWVAEMLTSPAAARLPGLDADAAATAWQDRQRGAGIQPHFWRWVNAIAWADTFDAR